MLKNSFIVLICVVIGRTAIAEATPAQGDTPSGRAGLGPASMDYFTKPTVLAPLADSNLVKAAESGDAESQCHLGVFYYGAKKMTDAAKWFHKAAEQGRGDAQCSLGFMYESGIGVETNYTEAVNWYRKAAEQGSGQWQLGAQRALGNLFFLGKGVSQDFSEAAKWYRKLAEQGDAASQSILGQMYNLGKGVPQDDTEAIKWYRMAAESGNAYAQFSLGDMYDSGCGVKANSTEAAVWYRKAAAQSNALAQSCLGNLYLAGRGVETNFTEAANWFIKSAGQGYVWAQVGLGKLYLAGRGVETNFTEAANWFSKAASQSNFAAQCELGKLYSQGLGVKKDMVKAVELLQKAADQDDIEAMQCLQQLFSDGREIPRDDTKADFWKTKCEVSNFRYTKKEAESGVADSQLGLARRYEEGKGTRKDDAEAAKWYRKAAEQDGKYGMAAEFLGKMYAEGRGVPQDFVLAYKWLNIAASGEWSFDAKRERDQLAEKMTASQVAEAQRMSREFQPHLTPRKLSLRGDSKDELLTAPPSGSGTAFCISKDGLFFTAAHVVADARHVVVSLKGQRYEAAIVSTDVGNDLAILKVKGTFQALPLVPSRNIKLGSPVRTLGYPNPEIQGQSPKLTKGEINSLAGANDDPRYFQISVPIQPGNSGGPLCDSKGNVVGLITARLADLATLAQSGSLPQNVNYAVKSTYLIALTENIPGAAASMPEPSTQEFSSDDFAERIILSVAMILVYE